MPYACYRRGTHKYDGCGRRVGTTSTTYPRRAVIATRVYGPQVCQIVSIPKSSVRWRIYHDPERLVRGDEPHVEHRTSSAQGDTLAWFPFRLMVATSVNQRPLHHIAQWYADKSLTIHHSRRFSLLHQKYNKTGLTIDRCTPIQHRVLRYRLWTAFVLPIARSERVRFLPCLPYSSYCPLAYYAPHNTVWRSQRRW